MAHETEATRIARERREMSRVIDRAARGEERRRRALERATATVDAEIEGQIAAEAAALGVDFAEYARARHGALEVGREERIHARWCDLLAE